MLPASRAAASLLRRVSPRPSIPPSGLRLRRDHMSLEVRVTCAAETELLILQARCEGRQMHCVIALRRVQVLCSNLPMRAFEVFLNKKKICVAGVGNDGVLSAIIDYVGGQRGHETALSVGGLITLEDEHVRWIERRKLRNGDEIRVRIVDINSVDNPTDRQRHDPRSELRRQKKYVRHMAKRLGWKISPAPQRRKRRS